MASRPLETEPAPSLARALINTSHLPLLLFDGDLRVAAASPSFCSAFDIDETKTDGRGLGDLGQGEWNIPQLRLLLDNALSGGPEMGDYETDLVRPGVDTRRLVVNVQNVDYEDKLNARILLTINDVTDAKRIERLNVILLLEKDGLLRERAVLLQEMQHRVANSLQIIASVLMLKARAVKSEETRLHLRDAHDRVLSVAAVQQHLQADLSEVAVGPYLTKLCESLSASMIRTARPLHLVVHAGDPAVSSHDAVSLGLIVTELVINALKHAFPGCRSGRIVVAYELKTAGWSLSVTDNGIGRPPASPKVKAGLGTTVVEALARQLGAEVVISDAHPGARIAVVSTPTLVH